MEIEEETKEEGARRGRLWWRSAKKCRWLESSKAFDRNEGSFVAGAMIIVMVARG